MLGVHTPAEGPDMRLGGVKPVIAESELVGHRPFGAYFHGDVGVEVEVPGLHAVDVCARRELLVADGCRAVV